MIKKKKKDAKILIVDDSITNVLLLKVILESENFTEILTANTGKDAIKILFSEEIDLLLLDILLPNKMSGWDIYETIKNNPKTANIPVIVISANNITGEIEKSKQLGALAYMMKPVNIEKLTEIINDLFE